MKKAFALFVPLCLALTVGCGSSTDDRDAGSGLSFNKKDGGSPADGGTNNDAGSQNNDAGNTQTDLTCSEVVSCANNCTDANCQQSCISSGSTTAQNLVDQLLTCLDQQCPSTSGGVCATQSSACQTCLQNAQNTGGACASDVQACQNDGQSPGTDGGTSSGTGCYGIILCENNNNCSTQQCIQNCYNAADSNGQSLYMDLNNCIIQACPSTSGGPCANQSSTTCTNCVRSAQQSGGACNSALSSCQQDM